MPVKAPHIFILFTSLTLLCPSLAGAITLEKGKWKFETRSENPPKTEISIECITNSNYDPVKEMTEDGDCTVSDKKETGNSVSWKMQCAGGGGMQPSQIEATFTSKGNTMSSKMTISFAGMVVTEYYDGKKISSKCDE